MDQMNGPPMNGPMDQMCEWTRNLLRGVSGCERECGRGRGLRPRLAEIIHRRAKDFHDHLVFDWFGEHDIHPGVVAPPVAVGVARDGGDGHHGSPRVR